MTIENRLGLLLRKLPHEQLPHKNDQRHESLPAVVYALRGKRKQDENLLHRQLIRGKSADSFVRAEIASFSSLYDFQHAVEDRLGTRETDLRGLTKISNVRIDFSILLQLLGVRLHGLDMANTPLDFVFSLITGLSRGSALRIQT